MSTGLRIFTNFHVAISLLAIALGLVVVFGMLAGRRFNGLTALFLITTVATSVTGFLFPVHHFMPSHAVGILSMILLALAILARYPRRLMGSWRWTYVLTAVTSLYLNVFVLIVQSFLKVPSLKSLAPTQTEPPFKLAQGVALLIFIVLGVLAVRRFHVSAPATTHQ